MQESAGDKTKTKTKKYKDWIRVRKLHPQIGRWKQAGNFAAWNWIREEETKKWVGPPNSSLHLTPNARPPLPVLTIYRKRKRLRVVGVSRFSPLGHVCRIARWTSLCLYPLGGVCIGLLFLSCGPKTSWTLDFFFFWCFFILWAWVWYLRCCPPQQASSHLFFSPEKTRIYIHLDKACKLHKILTLLSGMLSCRL